MTDKTLPPVKMPFADRINRLTTGEVREIERITGRPWSDEEAVRYISYLQAIYYVWKKRENPKFTFAQVEIALVEEINEFLGIGADDDEDEVAAELRGDAPKS